MNRPSIVGAALAGALALAVPAAAQHQRAFIPNENGDSISVVNADTNVLETTFNGGGALDRPTSVEVTPDELFVLVTDLNNDTLYKFDATPPFALVDSLSGFSDPFGIAVDGTTAYVVERGAARVAVVDLTTFTLSTTVAVGSSPRTVVVNPLDDFVYVTSNSNDRVDIIDVSGAPTNVGNIAVGDQPFGAEIDAVNGYMYVANGNSDSVTIIDINPGAGQHTVDNTVSVGDAPKSIAAHPNGKWVYVGDNGTPSSVTVFDALTRTVFTTIAMTQKPEGLSVDPDGTRLYASVFGSDAVTVISTNKNKINTTSTIGDGPSGYSPRIFTSPTPAATVSGTVGFDLKDITCENATTSTKVSVNITGSTWDCDALGVPSSPGDVMAIVIRGDANGSTPPTTTDVDGLTLTQLYCRNQATTLFGECTDSCLPFSETTTNCEDIANMPRGRGTDFTATAGDRVYLRMRGKRD